MKVKELIDQLQFLDPEAEVVIAKDSEGNGFGPLSEIEPGVYVAESTWSGFWCGDEYLGNPDYSQPEDQVPNVWAGRGVCLWPVN